MFDLSAVNDLSLGLVKNVVVWLKSNGLKLEDLKYLYMKGSISIFFPTFFLTHSHTMTPFDTPGKQAF